MTKRHLKRINMPWFWQVERKTKKFIARPASGPHKLDSCITIDLLIREFLKYAKINKEVRHILNNKKILVEKKAVLENNFPVGLMDIIDVVDLGMHYMISLDTNGKFRLLKITKEDANHKFCKIINKTMLKKNKLQLNLDDGQNIIIEKDEYKVGDTVVIDLNSKKIKKHLKLESNAPVLLTAGKHIGMTGHVEKINSYKGMRKSTIIFKGKDESFETLKEYCFVIDKGMQAKYEND